MRQFRVALALELTEEGWAMAHVTVTVNGRNYRMGCREGEERRIEELAAEIDALVQKIKGGTKAVQDDRLFLMAAIMMADQLWDAREDLQRAQKLMAEIRSYQVIDGGTYVAPRILERIADSSGKVEPLPQRAASGQ
jgi:cell division protein ZapA